MRRALVLSSTYEKSRLPAVPSAGPDARLVLDRLSEPELGFDATTLALDDRLEARLADVFEVSATGETFLVYFSGYASVSEDGDVELLLAGKRGGKLALRTLRERLARIDGSAACVFDLVHVEDPDALAQSVGVVEAVRDGLDPDETGVQLLVAARPNTARVPKGPSLLTRLWVEVLESLTSRGRAVTLRAVYEAMRGDEARFHELAAAGFFAPDRDFPLVRSQADAAPDSQGPPSSTPSSEPMSNRAPPKPRSMSKPKMRAVASLDATLASGDEHRAAGRVDDAIAEYKKALMLAGSNKIAKQAIYVRLGEVRLEAGNRAEAISNFDKALSLDPKNDEAFGAVTQLLRAERDYGRLEQLMRRRLDASDSEEARSLLLQGIAALWLDEAGDLRRGVEALERGLQQNPRDSVMLERLADAQQKLGRHAASVAARRKLAELMEAPEERAAVLAVAARTVAEHLPNKTDAIDLARTALDSDASTLEALELVAGLLGKKKRWVELAETYEAVLERTRDDVVAFELAKNLGLLYRDELDDAEGALRGFRRASDANPADIQIRYFLSELLELTGDLEAAREQFRSALQFDPRTPDLHRRTLWLSERLADNDGAWRACAALDHLGEADINESLLADQHRPEAQLGVQRGLTEEDWPLLYEERDRDVAAIFEIIADAAIQARRDDGEPDAPPQSTRQDPEGTTTLMRSSAWSAQLVGVDPPELHVAADAPEHLISLPREPAITLAQPAMGRGLGVGELAFLWTRHLTVYRPEHRLAVFFPELRDLAVVFLAALAVGGDADSAPESLAGGAAELAARFNAELDDDTLEALRDRVRHFDTTKAKRRVVRWRDSVASARARAGLLACGDIALAVAQVEKYFPVEGEWLVGDLLGWWSGQACGELRERLGVRLA